MKPVHNGSSRTNRTLFRYQEPCWAKVRNAVALLNQELDTPIRMAWCCFSELVISHVHMEWLGAVVLNQVIVMSWNGCGFEAEISHVPVEWLGAVVLNQVIVMSRNGCGFEAGISRVPMEWLGAWF